MPGDTNPLGGRPYGDQSAAFSNNLFLLGQNQQQQQFATPAGESNVTAAGGNLAQTADYEKGILSGDRSKILATEAPEISSLLSSYDAARKSAGQLAPRGGGRSEILNELPYKEAGDVNKLIQKARPEAAAALEKTATAQGLLGESEQSLANQDVNQSLNFLLGKSGVQLQSAQLQGQSGAAIGQAIGQLLPLILAG